MIPLRDAVFIIVLCCFVASVIYLRSAPTETQTHASMSDDTPTKFAKMWSGTRTITSARSLTCSTTSTQALDAMHALTATPVSTSLQTSTRSHSSARSSTATTTAFAAASQFWVRFYQGVSTTKLQVTFAAPVNDTSATVNFGATPTLLSQSSGCSTSSYTSPPAYTSPIIYACILDTTRLGSSFAPGSTLYYQVAASAALNASAVFSTPSHPGVGKSGVLLALLGDLGTSQNSVSTIEHVLANPEQLSAIVHVGDLAYADGDAAEWDTYGELFSASSMRPLSIP